MTETKKIKYSHQELVDAWIEYAELPAITEIGVGWGNNKNTEMFLARMKAWNSYVDVRDGKTLGTTHSVWKRQQEKGTTPSPVNPGDSQTLRSNNC